MEPKIKSAVCVLRGPHVSHSLPIINRAIMVAETAAIMVFPTCDFDKPRSALMVGINGAKPNHPKKQTKKVSHVIWKVFI
jgi:hypothetical protein